MLPSDAFQRHLRFVKNVSQRLAAHIHTAATLQVVETVRKNFKKYNFEIKR